jgi:hypothetical protein
MRRDASRSVARKCNDRTTHPAPPSFGSTDFSTCADSHPGADDGLGAQEPTCNAGGDGAQEPTCNAGGDGAQEPTCNAGGEPADLCAFAATVPNGQQFQFHGVPYYKSRTGRINNLTLPPPEPCFTCCEMHWAVLCPARRGSAPGAECSESPREAAFWADGKLAAPAVGAQDPTCKADDFGARQFGPCRPSTKSPVLLTAPLQRALRFVPAAGPRRRIVCWALLPAGAPVDALPAHAARVIELLGGRLGTIGKSLVLDRPRPRRALINAAELIRLDFCLREPPTWHPEALDRMVRQKDTYDIAVIVFVDPDETVALHAEELLQATLPATGVVFGNTMPYMTGRRLQPWNKARGAYSAHRDAIP